MNLGPRELPTDQDFVAKAYSVGRFAKPLDNDSLKYQVVVTNKLNQATLDYLHQGGRVVLLSNGLLKEYRPGVEYRPGKVMESGFKTKWNNLYRSTPWNMGEHGKTWERFIIDHPSLGKLPHEGWVV